MSQRDGACKIIILASALALALATGCSRGPREPTVLAAYDFATPRRDVAFGLLHGHDNGLHWFADGWARQPDAVGLWSLGRESTVRLRALGRRLRLKLACSTSPALADSGQTLTVLFDGREIVTLAMPADWAEVSCDTLLADEVAAGDHVLTFRPSRAAAPTAQDPRAYGIFLGRLEVTAGLDRRERSRWLEWNEAPPQPPAWEPAAVGSEPSPAPPFARPPDVLLILLDAAGAGHLGCHGYGRATSPEIDKLAAEGVRLEQAFTDAPFTVIAVPSLLTGLPFRDHGVTRKGQALADSFTTLPEIMRDRGWFTLALSDNPFVSRATGVAQGFEGFRELWYHWEHGHPNTNPELAENVLFRRAEKGFGDRPVFAYLHLMPPHSPYLPGEGHDLFSDPAYAGDIDGSAEQLQTIIDGQRAIGPADRDELEALYDGNLHRIDASVGRIVRRWRDLGRDRELLVIVMSDHGEAFDEHGRFDHLTTVYDEMTHIPLVLWPAKHWRHLSGSAGELYGIEDVVPMLLNRLGLAPPAGTRVTRRFLEVLAEPGRPRGEVVLRSIDHTHAFGLRTERWLAIYDRLGQELYDLDADPGARTNLRGEQPKVWRELVGRLRAILAGGAAGPEAESVQFSEEDLRRLRSLGYI